MATPLTLGRPTDTLSADLREQRGKAQVANEIIAVGMTCYDHVVVVPSLKTVGRGTRALDVMTQGGGVAATAAVAARSLGARVQLWARVGGDGHGEFLIADLRERGIDTSEMQVLEGARTAVSTVMVEKSTGDRRFLYFPGQGLDSGWEAPDYSRIDRCRALLVDGRWPGVCLGAVRRARARAVPVVVDVGHASAEETEILGLADYPVVSEPAFRECAGERSAVQFADELLAANALAVILTRGSRGIWMKGRDGQIERLKAFKVRTVDTTGAGDVFHGAFAFAVTHGRGVKDAALFASAAAAHSCTALGCRGAVPTLAEVEEMLASPQCPEWKPARS